MITPCFTCIIGQPLYIKACYKKAKAQNINNYTSSQLLITPLFYLSHPLSGQPRSVPGGDSHTYRQAAMHVITVCLTCIYTAELDNIILQPQSRYMPSSMTEGK